MEVGIIPQEYFIIPYKNHKEKKEELLSMLEAADAQELKDEGQQLTWTDLGVETRREYFTRLLKEDFELLFENFINYYNNIRGVGQWRDMRFSFWFNQYQQGDYVKWHNHPTAFMCAVYYPELPDPGDVILIKGVDGKIYKPNIVEGDVVFFPSNFVHSVTHNSSKRKTSINFNIVCHIDNVVAMQANAEVSVNGDTETSTIETV